MILGLQEFRQENLLVYHLQNGLRNTAFGWRTPLTDRHGHLYLKLNPVASIFSRSEIELLYLYFFHPSAKALYNLIWHSKISDAQTDLRKIIDDVTANCKECREHSTKPFRFRAIIPDDNVVFNHELAVDLMYLHVEPVLHVVDAHALPERSVRR